MPRLSRTQETARQQIIDLTRRALLPAPFSERLLTILAEVVPADAQQLWGVDPGTLLYNRSLALSASMRPHILWYLQHRYLREPVNMTAPALMRARSAALVLHDRPETCWGAPSALFSPWASAHDFQRVYHELDAPAGGLLYTFLQSDGQWLAALTLARFTAQRSFQRTDILFLHLMAPMLGRGLRRALDLERTTLYPPPAPEVAGMLVLGPDRRVQFSTPAADYWLARLQDAGTELEQHLPTVIWAAVARLRTEDMGQLAATVRICIPGSTLRVDASSCTSEDLTAIVLIPERAALPPDVPAIWPLTRQEREVLSHVVRGLTNRQIASTLMVTENTIEAHLRHIYEKVDVHSRSELLARLFQASYLSPLTQRLNETKEETAPPGFVGSDMDGFLE
jgi:DNA-binding CsgD family transcriptional regulator